MYMTVSIWKIQFNLNDISIKSSKYEIIAVILKEGLLYNGHFIEHVKFNDKNWNLFNDDNEDILITTFNIRQLFAKFNKYKDKFRPYMFLLANKKLVFDVDEYFKRKSIHNNEESDHDVNDSNTKQQNEIVTDDQAFTEWF